MTTNGGVYKIKISLFESFPFAREIRDFGALVVLLIGGAECFDSFGELFDLFHFLGEVDILGFQAVGGEVDRLPIAIAEPNCLDCWGGLWQLAGCFEVVQ
jgi:hypothetical protein